MSSEERSEVVARQKIWYSHQIRKIAENRNMSCAELSLLSGLSEEYIYRIWQGDVIPGKSAIQSISVALEVSEQMLQMPTA